MKKLSFIAILILSVIQISCSNDSQSVGNTSKMSPSTEDNFSMQRLQDTLTDKDTGGQSGTIPPTRP